MLRALNTAVAALQTAAHSETAVYDIFGAQLKNLDLQGSINMLNEDQTQFVVQALVMPDGLIRALKSFEKGLGIKGVGYTYARKTAVIDEQVIRDGKAIYIPDNTEKLKQVFPNLSFLVRQAFRVFSGMPAILAPITRVGEARGVLYLAGSQLKAEDVPAIAAFANQISLALQDAHLFEAVRRTEDQYRRLFETANDAILVVDVESLRVLSTNPRMAFMSGYTEAALLSMTIDNLIPLAHPSEIGDFVEETRRQKSVTTHSHLRREDGHLLDVQLTATVFEMNGRTLLHGFIRDITEQKRGESLQTAVYQIATIANSDISLEDLYQSIHRVVGQFLDARNFYIALYDEPENILSLPYFVDERDTYNGRPYPAGRGMTESVIRSGQPCLIDEEGQRRLIQQNVIDEVGPLAKIWLGAPLKTKAETIGAIVVQNYHDRTAYSEQEEQFLVFVSGQIAAAITSKRAELKLKQLAAQLEDQVQMMDVILSTTPDFFLIHDVDGRIRYASPAVIQQLDLSATEILGKTWSEVKSSDNLLHEFNANIHEAGRSGQPASGEIVIQSNGGKRYFEYSLYPVCDRDGRITSIVLTSRDITDRKRAEELLHHTQKMESLGVLAGGVAHDFNNLLVAIMGQTSLALSQLSAEAPAYRHVEKAVKAAEKASELTQQLLAFSGRRQFSFQPLQLTTIIRENQHLLDVVIPHNVRLETYLTNDLPLIEADPGQIQQVVMNLILNAAEAMEGNRGTIHITTGIQTISEADTDYWQRTKQQLKPGNYVFLTVNDDGCGMSEETMSRIFDPFFTTKFTGRGLGLAAALGIMRGHKGALRVTSEVGLGTTFDLLFPITGLPPAALPDIPQKKAATTAVILVIDDEEPVREAIKDILEMENIGALVASDGRSGLELYQQYQDVIDLVIVDWFMPNMNGSETLQALQQINPDVRVLMSSGYSEAETNNRLNGRATVGFLQKPYTLNRLVDEITRHLL
ncbi:MAG: PAS domain S-box protein [Chloroflexi bacterium]|nr:PAS domain S-box protein [Chloroflexota bacterium]